MRSFAGPKNLHRVWIEGNDDWRSICRSGVIRRGRDNCLMASMHTIKNSDGKKKGTGQMNKVWNGT
jgi:hypothetical protein